MICKLQIDTTNKRYLIYNRDKSVLFEGKLSDEIRDVMTVFNTTCPYTGKVSKTLLIKAFFKCSIINNKIVIERKVGDKRW